MAEIACMEMVLVPSCLLVGVYGVCFVPGTLDPNLVVAGAETPNNPVLEVPRIVLPPNAEGAGEGTRRS